jgi:hypothetical protein
MLNLAIFASSWGQDVLDTLHDLIDSSVAHLTTHMCFACASEGGTVLEPSLYTV